MAARYTESSTQTNDRFKPPSEEAPPVLKKRGGDFHRRGVILYQQAGCTSAATCCCSCLHIVGALVGAVIGLSRGLSKTREEDNAAITYLPPQGATSNDEPAPAPAKPAPSKSEPDNSAPAKPAVGQLTYVPLPAQAPASPGLVLAGLVGVVAVVAILGTIGYFVSNAGSPTFDEVALEPLVMAALVFPTILLVPICALAVLINYFASPTETAAANASAAFRVSMTVLGYSALGCILGAVVMVLFLCLGGLAR